MTSGEKSESDRDRQLPVRQVRAAFDETNIVVYQAYPPEIAGPAVAAGKFVPPFKMGRMTWIKPSFLWMMYRSGWASKPGQERVLRIRILRSGFEQALAEGCLSHYDPAVHVSRDAWLEHKEASAVRIQWDPERTPQLEPLPWRTIQIGIGGPAVDQYASDWITTVEDITDFVIDLSRRVAANAVELPVEPPYPLPDHIARAIGATS